MDRKRKLFDGLSILLGGFVLPVVGSILCIIFLSYWFWQNLLIHTAVEALGGFIAWLIAVIILVMHRRNQIEPVHIWTSCALLGMGTLDFLHSCVPPGTTFVWLHSTATLVGGVFFAMTWLPQRIAKSRHISSLPVIIPVAASIFGVCSILFPQLLPAMVSQGKFTLTARLFNISGGILFLSAAVRFCIKYKKSGNREDFIFTNHCLLFGIAGLLFELSVLWGAGWWWWHFLRLTAYLLALCYLFVIYRRLEETVRVVNKQLNNEITERKYKESDLEQYGILFDNISDLAYICDTEGDILFLNSVFEKLSGHKPEQFIGKSFAPLFDKENLKKAMDLYTRTLKGESLKREICFRDTGVLCEYKNRPLRDKKGNIVGVLGTARDITERKHLENERKNINKSLEQRVAKRTKEWAKANEALQIKIVQHKRTEEILRKSEEKYSRLIENLQDNYFFYSHNTEGVFTYLSPAITNILGYATEEFLTHYSEYMTDNPGNAKVIRHTDLSIKGIKQPPYELEIYHKDGSKRTLKVQEVPVFDNDHNVIAVEGIAEDVTESKHAEEKLVTYQTQLKRLSSALSLTEERERRHISEDLHDRIGQALTVIKMKLEELGGPQVDTDSDRVLNEAREILDNAIHDTRTLTFEISPPLLYELGFEPAVEWLIEQFRERHNIPIEYEGNGGGGILDDDMSFFLFKSVRELLFNIVKHAEAERIKVSAQRDKDRIRVRIEDNGVGFDSSNVQFSVDNLSGFGLFSIRERMEQFGGDFDVESEPGQGTRITLALSLKQQEGDRGAKR
ncbi:MAG: PAS domain-containing sensor histidine kinase [Planctomycetota bacterium]|jgi:PAS domain S-box-containing protein